MVKIEVLEKVLGSKGRVRIITTFFENEDDLLSIRKASMLSKVSYSKAYNYVKEMEAVGLLKRYGSKYILNKGSELYEVLKGMFSTEQKRRMSSTGKEFLRLIKKHENIGIYVHHNADPDAVCSAVSLSIALKKLGIKNEVVAPAPLSAQSKALLRKYPYPINMGKKTNHDLIVAVDTASEEQLPGVKLENVALVVVDHHKYNTLQRKARLRFIDPTARSTCTIMYDLINSLNIEFDAQIRFFLSVGIVADSGFLRTAGNREIKILAKLLEDISLQEVMTAIHLEKDRSERIAVLKALRRMEIYEIDDEIIVLSEIGSFEASCAHFMIRAGADIAIVANLSRDEIRISCRASTEASKTFNLIGIFRKIESVLNGKSGGHETAISFNGKSPENWEDAKKEILTQFESIAKKKIKRIG